MSIHSRTVKNKRDSNGRLTGRPGTVYDVAIKYKTTDGFKSYMKRGFSTTQEASLFESTLKAKYTGRSSIIAALSPKARQTMQEYLNDWIEKYGVNLRASTLAGYKSNIKNHLIPHIGHMHLKELTPEILDDMYQNLFSEGLSASSVRYCHRILSVALESARKYHYIEGNPTHDVITKFSVHPQTPDPYTVTQMQTLMANSIGTEWKMMILLGGLYGLRISEVIGLRWINVDIPRAVFRVVEQLPFQSKDKLLPKKLAPVKSHTRELPITESVLPFFQHQQMLQARQKRLASLAGSPYYDNGLVIAKADGSPYNRSDVSEKFGYLLKRLNLPHIRFHDLRHTAATNMHELTGDFYSVSKILGHSLKAMGTELGVSADFDSVTAQYVDVRIERKREVLETYHQAVFGSSSKLRQCAGKHEMER